MFSLCSREEKSMHHHHFCTPSFSVCRPTLRSQSKNGYGVPFWKAARKTAKKARVSSACRTPKILGKQGKNAQKRKEFLEKEKGKENQKGKEKKIRVYLWSHWAGTDPFRASGPKRENGRKMDFGQESPRQTKPKKSAKKKSS